GTINDGSTSSIAGEVAPFTHTSGTPPWDVAFTVTVDPGGSSPQTASGTVRKSRVADLGWDGALAEAIKTALSNASISGVAVAVTLDGGGKIQLAPTGKAISFDFATPLSVTVGGGRVTISLSAQTETFDSHQAGANLQPRTDINLDYANSAFQELGLSATPT